MARSAHGFIQKSELRRLRYVCSSRSVSIRAQTYTYWQYQNVSRFPIQNLGNRRDMFVYLPPGYRRFSLRRYPVLYLHDGQNVFDAVTSFAGVEWGVDETAQRFTIKNRASHCRRSLKYRRRQGPRIGAYAGGDRTQREKGKHSRGLARSTDIFSWKN